MDEKVSGPGGASQRNWSHPVSDELPLDMRFNRGHLVSVTVYSALLVLSAAGNLTVLAQLVRRRRARRASRLDVLLMHLAIADLMVTFLMMPLEIAWAGTVQWLAGDAMCRLMMFARTYGLYLSSFVLICIAVDRYYAILKPLNVSWERRVRRALAAAWGAAALASLPQSLIFHLEEHPDVRGYYQCVTYGSLPTERHEFAYFLLNMALMYLAPLLSTLYCSAAALLEIVRRANTTDKMRRHGVGILGRARARTLKMSITIVLVFFTCWSPYYCYCMWLVHSITDKMRRHGVGILSRARARTLKMSITIVLMFFTCWSPYYCYCMWLVHSITDKMRRHGVGILGRARARTLKMSITIVLVFFTCWSPYYCYCMWYWIDKEYVSKLDPAFQKAMWLFSCTNSCANPIVYGIFNRNRWSWRSRNGRCRHGARRGSRFPHGDSMEISAATLARARSSLASRRDSHNNNAPPTPHNNNVPPAPAPHNDTNGKHINNNNHAAV